MTFNPSFTQQITSGVKSSLENRVISNTARVTHVVTGPVLEGTNVPDRYYKDSTSLGLITFQLLDGTQNRTSNSAGNPTAKPLNFSFKQIPLVGEFVQIYIGPSIGMNESIEAPEYYYTFPINIWNASHHNAFPHLGDYQQFVTNTKRGYEGTQTLNQPNNVSVTSSVNYPLGPNFPEKDNIRSLRLFAGDVAIEGRWGNSIRFGSTSAESKDQNTWSKSSEPGNPITIIRNGQGRQENNINWFPTVENINRDPSSIYLTEGQEIVIDDINNNFSLASLDVVLSRTYTLSIPIQQQLTSTDNISAGQQDEIMMQVGRGVSTSPIPPTARPIPQTNAELREQQVLLQTSPTIPRRG